MAHIARQTEVIFLSQLGGLCFQGNRDISTDVLPRPPASALVSSEHQHFPPGDLELLGNVTGSEGVVARQHDHLRVGGDGGTGGGVREGGVSVCVSVCVCVCECVCVCACVCVCVCVCVCE